MKKILNTIIFLLIGVTVLLFGVQLFTGEESPSPQPPVEASEPFKKELTTLEERMKSIYTDESEQDVNLKTYKEVSPAIQEAIEKLNKETSLEKSTEKFQGLTDEWQVIQDMVYVKDNLEKRFEDDEITSDKPMPKDFEKRLKSLEKPKPEFYKKHQKLYKAYKEVLKTQQESEEELADIQEALLLENGTINPNVLDVELITYRNRLEILGDSELIGLIDAELARREQQQAALEAQQEAERQAAEAERQEAQRQAEEAAALEAEEARRAEEEAREAEANADRFVEVPSNNRAPSRSEESTSSKPKESNSSESEEETTDSESESDEDSTNSEQAESNDADE